LLVLIYAILAIFAWSVSCVLAYTPIRGNSYSINTRDRHYTETTQSVDYFNQLYLDNEAWYRAARIIQSIVTVLTIPLTSTVCGRAAVAFVQQQGRNDNITMRQTMALADKGWTDVRLLSKLLRGQWKRYGSSFLAVAIFLNSLGAVISPLQELFLFTETIKVPSRWQAIINLVDMSDHVQSSYIGSDYTVVLARSRLSSTRVTDIQARLWSQEGRNCTENEGSTSDVCQFGGGQHTLASLPSMDDPFFSELPYTTSTGLLSQFAPRANSTASREIIANEDFPTDCDQNPNGFYIHYNNTSEDASSGNRTSSYSVEVCMPGDVTQPAWETNRTRQDRNEELYLKIRLDNCSHYPTGEWSRRITLNTTVGYFELPNYANGELPGPLLEDPDNLCGSSCKDQGTIRENKLKPRAAATDSGTAVNATSGVLSNYKKGPLLTMAMALFGIGSFLDVVDDLAAYREAHREVDLEAKGECITTVPFLQLTRTVENDNTDLSDKFPFLDPCLEFQATATTETTDITGVDATNLAAEYLWIIVNALEAAAFITNEVWMVDDPRITSRHLTVNSDMGEDTQKPGISDVGIAIVSILLLLDLFCLAALALYSARVPRWTEQLDSFAMMRLGAAMADDLPLQVANKTERISILDETPGCIGDATGGEGTVGELGIGAKTPLRARRRYTCYNGDHESEDVAEKQVRH
ncbi:hypothetical protein BJ166DRAFT_463050, partial [Pestalotiopsis sp. NC0098]